MGHPYGYRYANPWSASRHCKYLHDPYVTCNQSALVDCRASAPCRYEVKQKYQSSRLSSDLLPGTPKGHHYVSSASASHSGRTRGEGNNVLDATNLAKQYAWSLFRRRATGDERTCGIGPAQVKDANVPDGRI